MKKIYQRVNVTNREEFSFRTIFDLYSIGLSEMLKAWVKHCQPLRKTFKKCYKLPKDSYQWIDLLRNGYVDGLLDEER